MKVVATAEIGELGVKEGPPVAYTWTRPSLLPPLLPWLAILVLLIVPPNRAARAWWIWAPLGLLAAVLSVPQSTVESLIPSQVAEPFVEAITALSFGAAAVWLLAPYLARKYRILTFFMFLLILAGFSGLTLLVRIAWGEDSFGAELLEAGMMVGTSVLAISAAVNLAGLVCRGKYSPLRLCLWLLLAVLVLWVVIIGPFFAIAAIGSSGNVPFMAFLGSVLALSGVSLGVLLPFFILSFANPFYRDRLKTLLRLDLQPPPAVTPAPAPEAVVAK